MHSYICLLAVFSVLAEACSFLTSKENAAENVPISSTRRPQSMNKARSLLGGLPTDASTNDSMSSGTAEEYAHRTSFDNIYNACKVIKRTKRTLSRHRMTFLDINNDGGGKIA